MYVRYMSMHMNELTKVSSLRVIHKEKLSPPLYKHNQISTIQSYAQRWQYKKTLVKNVYNQVSVLPEWKFISMSWIKSVSYTTYCVSVLLTCVIFRVAISTLTIAYITPFQLVVTIVLPRGLVRAYVRCTIHFARLDNSQKLFTQHLHILWQLIIVPTCFWLRR